MVKSSRLFLYSITSLLLVVAPMCSFANVDSNIIKYTGSNNYPPLEWVDERNNIHGILPEIIKKFGEDPEIIVSIDLKNWEDAQKSVLNGEANLIALIGADYRKNLYEFSEPIYYISHAIYTMKGERGFTGLDELINKRVAVVSGSFAEYKLGNAPNLNSISVDTELQCLNYVVKRFVDACIEVTISSNYLIELHKLPLEMSSLPFWSAPYVFAVKKGNVDLINAVNSKLTEVVTDGTYGEIIKRWENDFQWYSLSFWNKYKLWLVTVSVLLIVFFLALVFNYLLKRKVIKSTSELKNELKITKELKTKLSYLADYDEQTELLNRNGFNNRLKNELTLERMCFDGSTFFSVQITNIDTLISVMGYAYSLNVIKHVGHTLLGYDEIELAHLGRGVYVLFSNNSKKLEQILNYIINLRFSTFSLEPDLVVGYVTIDAEERIEGIKHIDEHIDELIRKSITALSYAKRKYLSICKYDVDAEPNKLNEKLLTDFKINKCKDFILFYQPQVCLIKNKVIGYEALVRWNHPELGLISPNSFIPLFEKANNMYDITVWVVKEVIKFLNDLDSQYVTVSINITTQDIVNDKFIHFITSILKKTEPSRLVFEVTESSFLENFDIAKENMEILNRLGVSFSIDDFGTGYSTLAYLNELPIKELKIDQCFVSKLNTSEKSKAITESIITLAHELGLRVVAEGVENYQTLEYLIMCGCEKAQGYYYSKPVCSEEVIKFTRNYNKIG
ncbi:EAL domain-containing protein [Vibrio sp. dhg]|uniref:EAL domain-containing protein n=1 Tax=Vibrio sp. dhg TaxID=2163016 RepID=UPI000E4C399F|nr:EAL domain-containing protein [Vibrio sp. dhg]AXT74040.1 hypothetical protein DBX26_24350 [Vibrio sp. dhg]